MNGIGEKKFGIEEDVWPGPIGFKVFRVYASMFSHGYNNCEGANGPTKTNVKTREKLLKQNTFQRSAFVMYLLMSIHNANKHMHAVLFIVVAHQPKLWIFFYYAGLATPSRLKNYYKVG
jgi:hypothetical protein